MPISCPHCDRYFPKSDEVNARHKAVCVGWKATHASPKAEPCLCGHTDTSLTQMKRHRQECMTWRGRDRGKVQTERLVKTLRETYKTDTIQSLRDVPGTEDKRKATMRERYGADYAFEKGSTLRPKIEAGQAAARPEGESSLNPFSWAETKEKIRATMETRYGVSHPMHVPEIKAKMQQTSEERHGGIAMGSPTLRARIEATNQVRYGYANAGGAPEVVERARMTNRARWGVDWTCQVPSIRARQAASMQERYGAHYFASEQGRAEVRRSLMEKYGADCPSKIDGFWAKAVATFVRKYGAEHPLQLAEYLDKRRQTCLERYGFDSPVQSPEVYAKIVQTTVARYGVVHLMKIPEVAEARVRKARHGMRSKGMNQLERDFAALHPELHYTGMGDHWVRLSTTGRSKNPDFVLPGLDSVNPTTGVTVVVEIFGDYWHSKIFTGKEPYTHESELVAAYAAEGVRCLVVWEGDFRRDPAAVRERVLEHLSSVSTD